MTYFNKIKIALFVFILLTIYSSNTFAQWNIPSELEKAPVEASYKLVKKGKVVYKNNCASCHGTPGQGDNLAAINATDLGSKAFQKSHSDGLVFWKIGEGNGGMPSFKESITDEDKWNLSFYIKSLDENFIISGEKRKAVEADMELAIDDKTKTLNAKITVSEEAKEDVEVQFYIKRTFGNMLIANATTDDNGIASYTISKEYPGDKEGNFDILVKFKDADSFGKKEISKTLKWGTELHFDNITDKRETWGANDRVPLWILLSYLIVVLSVWSVILYVAVQLIKLKNVGKKKV